MKISELKEYCDKLLNEHGDYEIARSISGGVQQYKPIEINLSIEKTGWIKKRTCTIDEEITVKRRGTVYLFSMDEDTN